MDKVLVIGGPTAVGKTSLGIKLAEQFHGEIISGDSMQVYKNLNIGTAKVTKQEMGNISHHLIDVKEMTEEYSAYDFQQAGRKIISEIKARGKLPIVVGGTGLYIQTLLYDFQLGTTKTSEKDKLKYEEYLIQHGNKKLWELLNQKDSYTASKIHPNNPQRLIRALTVLDAGGSIWQDERPDPLYDSLIIGLNTDRDLLYKRINQRVDLMMQQGLEKEAEMVFQLGNIQGAKAIGYKEFFPYFRGESSLEEAVMSLKQNSRKYAKRQITWFKNRLNTQWYDIILNDDAYMQMTEQIRKWLNNE